MGYKEWRNFGEFPLPRTHGVNSGGGCSEWDESSLVGQVSADLTYPQLSRMALAAEADEVHNIVQI
jgi:hypothetical protein